ncbi:hypothetical protein ACFYVL_08960 [Streptomyces sp. NPDC004111]|uniref:hypothetical protein n=1 Tax=Streptomyces sp. NPDC004111 TaxID=3364690 RepID=UPI0036957226
MPAPRHWETSLAGLWDIRLRFSLVLVIVVVVWVMATGVDPWPATALPLLGLMVAACDRSTVHYQRICLR